MINIEILFVNWFFSFLWFFYFFPYKSRFSRPFLPIPPDADVAPVIHVADLDSAARRAGMHDLVVTYINTHMARIAHHISRLLIRIADRTPASGQCSGLSGGGDAKMSVYQMDKSGTVRTVRQAVASAHVRIAHKLQRIGRNGAS